MARSVLACMQMHQHVYLEALAMCAVEQPSFHRLALKTLIVADLQAPTQHSPT